MKSTEERDDVLPAGVIARQLHGALHRLRAGVAIEEAMVASHWSHSRQALRQVGQRFVVEISSRDVNQFRGLLLNCGYDLGMAMASGGDGDAGGKVEELVAIHVLYANAAAAPGHERIRARIAGGNQPVICG